MDLAYDTETTGLNLISRHEMFAYSTCDPNENIEVKRLDGNKVRQIANRKALDQLWQDKSIVKVMHNAKFDMRATEKCLGAKFAETHPFHDTFIQGHILMNHHPSLRLKDLCWELAGIPKDDEEQVNQIVREGGNYSHVPEHIMNVYQERDAVRAMLLHLFFYPKIQANPKYMEIYKTELDLIRATMRMEERGMMLNRRQCNKIQDQLSHDVDLVLDELYEMVGTPINPNSPDQVRWLLYQKLNMPVLGRTKTKKPSTAKEVLLELRETCPSRIIDLVLMGRSWTKGIVTLQSYLDLAGSDDIIHPDIRTCQAITGRQSCRNPNLQNVAKEGVLLNPYPIPARRAFMPRPGYINFHIDYAGIELRLLIYYSREPELLELMRVNGDPHSVAAEVFYKNRFLQADKELKKTLRGAAKNCNFAIPYGASADRVAATLGVSRTEGARLLRAYGNRWPLMIGLSKKISSKVEQLGYIETAFGRRLHVPRDKAYVGTNYLIQGTAAGILKRAQNRVHKYVNENCGGEIRLLLPIHDEIVMEYPRYMLKDAKKIMRDIRDLMVDFPIFDIPLEVEVEVSTANWADKHEFDIAA